MAALTDTNFAGLDVDVCVQQRRGSELLYDSRLLVNSVSKELNFQWRKTLWIGPPSPRT
jgi:hypothetical protein